jgi:hypothetical protein
LQPLGNETMHQISHKDQDCYPLLYDIEVLLALDEAGFSLSMCGLSKRCVKDRLEVSRAGVFLVVARQEIKALVVAQVLEYRTCLSSS